MFRSPAILSEVKADTLMARPYWMSNGLMGGVYMSVMHVLYYVDTIYVIS